MLNFINFNAPYISDNTDKAVVMAVLELDRIIDAYDYHDFPSEQWEWYDLESIEDAINQLMAIKLSMLKLEEGSKDA